MINDKSGVYANILKNELITSLGCTEPSAIAFVAATAQARLGRPAERCVVEASGNIIKNAKSAVVPNTGGMKGIKAAAAAGMIAGKPELELETLRDVTDGDVLKVRAFLDSGAVEFRQSDRDALLYVAVTLSGGGDTVYVELEGGHNNITRIEKNGELLFTGRSIEEAESDLEYELLNVLDIVDFAENADIEELRPVIRRQIEYNYDIAREGMENDWGANIGSSLISAYGDDVKVRAAAMAAAGSDARMSGCDMHVVIVSGSGNQGITASAPVVEFGRELGCSEDTLIRAVILSDLVTIHQKTSIGKLSAFCGAVSAGCGAAAGIAFLLGGDYDIIAHTIVNSLATVAGMVCDGAKPSCAAKIAVAVHAGILGYSMYAKCDQQFYGGDGIVKRGVDNTITNVGRMASRGMRETDREILRIMTEDY
jgi:L-cysteine desulfidase